MSLSNIHLSAVATFRGLSQSELALLEARLAPMTVQRGTALVREGEPADALYVVVTGRFSVHVSGHTFPIAEISNGATIGEIAFFAGGPRTATCTAIRDSVVVRLTRADFDVISAQVPAIWSNITATMAERLAAETRKNARASVGAQSQAPARTLAIVRAGPHAIPHEVMAGVLAFLARQPQTVVLSSQTLSAHGLQSDIANEVEASRALNDLESRFNTVVYIADNTLTDWSVRAIHQADEIILIGSHSAAPLTQPIERNELEDFSYGLEQPPHHRLVLFHDQRGAIQGTRHWLAERPVVMHHHVALSDIESLHRLWRFIRGDARGFVACGGGAYCAAHIGIYRAFTQHGITFDIFGGSSGGAAMSAAFCEGLPHDEISARVQATFIDGKAMRRFTLPRYGLLDHKHFDIHMKALYGERRIEDLWIPYFAVTMDLNNVAVDVLRHGPVWEAVRASAAIPGLLPPFIDKTGRLLVDGSVAANVPIDIMHQLKQGPNVVVTFDPPIGSGSTVAYDSLPGRRELLKILLNPWSKRSLPAAPSAANVLVRALMANRNHFEKHLAATDWLLMPPLPMDLTALDWRTHRQLADTAYHYTLEAIKARRSTDASMPLTWP